MIGIQHYPNVTANAVAFKSLNESTQDAKNERDKKLQDINNEKAEWEEFANQLENSDVKIIKKSSKLARFCASAFGLAATFIGAKYGSKIAIESLKTLGKSPTSKTITGHIAGIGEKIKGYANSPIVKDTVEKMKGTNAYQAVEGFFKNEKVAKILEPVKNTVNSIKNTKINGQKVQSCVENTMAGVTTGSVLVDNIAGRNDDKSIVELASAV